MVKEFELDPMADMWIFLDAYTHVQQELPVLEKSTPIDIFESDVKLELPPSTEEYGISTAASIARLSLRKGRAVGLVAAGHQLVLLPPDRGGRQLGKILEALALLKARGMTPLRTIIETQVKHIARGSTVVLVSPTMNRDNDVVVDFLVQRGLRPVFIFIDAQTFGGPRFNLEETAFRFKAMGIPLRRIAYGIDIGFSLSTDF